MKDWQNVIKYRIENEKLLHRSDNYSHYRQRYNQHKSKGYPSLMACLRKIHPCMGKAQQQAANLMWRSANATGLVPMPLDELYGMLRKKDPKNWKRTLVPLLGVYNVVRYVHIESTPVQHNNKLHHCAAMMFNPSVILQVTSWDKLIHIHWLYGCWSSGVYRNINDFYRAEEASNKPFSHEIRYTKTGVRNANYPRALEPRGFQTAA